MLSLRSLRSYLAGFGLILERPAVVNAAHCFGSLEMCILNAIYVQLSR